MTAISWRIDDAAMAQSQRYFSAPLKMRATAAAALPPLLLLPYSFQRIASCR